MTCHSTALAQHSTKPTNNTLTREGLLAAATQAVKSIRARRTQTWWIRHSDDDVIADVVEACLRIMDKGQQIHRGYVYGVADNLLRRDRATSSADAKANRLLADKIHELEQQQGSQVTENQRLDLARQVIAEWDPGARKPAATFYRRTTVVSLDACVDQGLFLVDMVADTATSTDPFPLSPARAVRDDSVLELLDAVPGAVGKAEWSKIRRQSWDALAQVTGAPTVRARLTKHKVTALRSVIVRHPGGPCAGIAEAIAAFDQGLDNDLTTALFAPFDTNDPDERAAVVRQLRAWPQHAADLWVSALAAANNDHHAA